MKHNHDETGDFGRDCMAPNLARQGKKSKIKSIPFFCIRLGDKPNRARWKFGFPVFNVTDLLQLAEAAAALGYGRDMRLVSVIDIIRGKQNERWAVTDGIRLHRQDAAGFRREETAE